MAEGARHCRAVRGSGGACARGVVCSDAFYLSDLPERAVFSYLLSRLRLNKGGKGASERKYPSRAKAEPLALYHIEFALKIFGVRFRIPPLHNLKFMVFLLVLWFAYFVLRNFIPAIAPI